MNFQGYPTYFDVSQIAYRLAWLCALFLGIISSGNSPAAPRGNSEAAVNFLPDEDYFILIKVQTGITFIIVTLLVSLHMPPPTNAELLVKVTSIRIGLLLELYIPPPSFWDKRHLRSPQ